MPESQEEPAARCPSASGKEPTQLSGIFARPVWARAFWAAGASRGLANQVVCCGHAPARRPKCPESEHHP